MNNILIVGKYTFIELLKSKITYVSLALSFFILFVSYIASEFTLGAPEIVALDVGFGALSILSILISFFVGINLMSDEINNRTIYMVLARPVTREKFFLGKSIGLISNLVLNIFLIYIFAMSTFLFLGGKFDGLMIHAFMLIIFEAILLLLMVILFSLISNKTITLLISFSVYASGHTIPELLKAKFIQSNELLRSVLEAMKLIIPSFYKFNIKNFVIYNSTLPDSYVFNAYLYGFIWILIFIFLNFVAIKRVEFK